MRKNKVKEFCFFPVYCKYDTLLGRNFQPSIPVQLSHLFTFYNTDEIWRHVNALNSHFLLIFKIMYVQWRNMTTKFTDMYHNSVMYVQHFQQTISYTKIYCVHKCLPVKHIMVKVAHISQECIHFTCHTDSKHQLLVFSCHMRVPSFVLEAWFPPADFLLYVLLKFFSIIINCLNFPYYTLLCGGVQNRKSQSKLKS